VNAKANEEARRLGAKITRNQKTKIDVQPAESEMVPVKIESSL